LALAPGRSQLLGYPNFGTLSLVPKMADHPKRWSVFARSGRKARPFAEKDLADMRTFAREHLKLADPQAWDWPYISEKLKEARYAFSEQEVKQYFTCPRCWRPVQDCRNPV
jgi:oligopeptidase A